MNNNHERFLAMFRKDSLVESVGFHVSTESLSSIKPLPMFLFKTKSISNMLLKAFEEERDSANQYTATITGKILDINKARKLLGNDYDDYNSDMVSNPTTAEILHHDITILIKNAGYAGVELDDYHPGDPQKSAISVLVFDAKKALSNFKPA